MSDCTESFECAVESRKDSSAPWREEKKWVNQNPSFQEVTDLQAEINKKSHTKLSIRFALRRMSSTITLIQ